MIARCFEHLRRTNTPPPQLLRETFAAAIALTAIICGTCFVYEGLVVNPEWDLVLGQTGNSLPGCTDALCFSQ
jgi:hypothetical protein